MLCHPDPEDAIDVLSKVGGLDLAALAGFLYRLCLLSDPGGAGRIDYGCGCSGGL